ncbi:MAG: beta-ketoacyl-[acyl-carrier-protein] synthase family protein [Planctomycetaceae bacterium]|nr:beta-ketoacyl-[acyl-carrier-protein] synthase family protein [Planctomycetaceae bacterium]MBV8317499.1 beta-ketoacyl-[acyl-carrier-protein] synthase family protein [Planctomycetaceae bacterium]MBV8381987.1 beta-ketoacyl-[acyl-carrier-protein] synthase family protein [Planctomycetaceae bacterium]
MAERIVVVGHAAVTCLGRDMDATWRGLVAGRSGIRRHAAFGADAFLQDLAGIVEDLGPGTASEDPAVAKLGARSIHLAMASARAAWAEAGLDRARFRSDRAAVVIGSALGGLDLLDAEQTRMNQRRNLATSPFLVPGLIINQAAGQVAQHLGLHGPSVAPANACASGGHAVALGALLLRAGEADLALCGAGESAFTPAIVNGFATMKALLPRKPEDRSATDPSQASRPFSVDRAGFVLSEGAGMLVLATESAARGLGLEVQAELAGWSMNSDGHHVALPFGERIVACLRAALNRAEVLPGAVDYYNAHGTSTPINDRVETEVLKQVFGDHARALPVSSIKGALGHSLGAASAIEAAACVRAIREQAIPPTINHLPDPALDLDYVPDEARAARLDVVLSASFGFGGTNNALVLRRWNS